MAVTEETALWLEETSDTDEYLRLMVAAMKRLKVSQADLARLGHRSPSAVSQIINHKRRHIWIGRVPKWLWGLTRTMVRQQREIPLDE